MVDIVLLVVGEVELGAVGAAAGGGAEEARWCGWPWPLASRAGRARPATGVGAAARGAARGCGRAAMARAQPYPAGSWIRLITC